jgi:peptidyl-prolyl cis-trans isomerase SurA
MTNRRILAICAALVAAGVTTLAAQGTGTIIQKIIVKVNGEIFTQADLEMRQIQALRDQNRQVRNPQDLTGDAALRSALADVTPTILSDAVDELLLVQHGREMGARFTDESFNQALDNIKKDNKLDDAALAVALKQEGLTLSDLRQNFERAYMVQYVQQREIMRNMTLTEEESRQYYRTHQSAFMKPPTVTVREILISVPVDTVGGQAVVNVAADEAAKAKIDAARERALKGEDFTKIVADVSDSGTKANGGLIGPLAVDDLSPALKDMLAKMKPGDVSEPLRTQRGYQMFQLETKTDAEVEPFETVRDQVSQKIYNERLDGETKKFLEKLRAQALIEWKDDAYKRIYEQAVEKRSKTP